MFIYNKKTTEYEPTLRCSALRTLLLMLPLCIAALQVLSQTSFEANASAKSVKADPTKYAVCVLDMNTGRILFEANSTALRYPASLTKMMTLYLVFEDLHNRRIRLEQLFRVSRRAAAQPPSKLGLTYNSKVSVSKLIQSVASRSANDAALVIAENIATNESNFAKRMTDKAKELGMRKTSFHNSSGLPNIRHVTTACDMARLGMAIRSRFPTYYKKFISARSFVYNGRTMYSTNHLLRKFASIDGIKTGYTRASGFNIVSSMRRNNCGVIAAVMGLPTAAARDRYMYSLLKENLSKASLPEYVVKLKNDKSEIAISSRSHSYNKTKSASLQTAGLLARRYHARQKITLTLKQPHITSKGQAYINVNRLIRPTKHDSDKTTKSPDELASFVKWTIRDSKL